MFISYHKFIFTCCIWHYFYYIVCRILYNLIWRILLWQKISICSALHDCLSYLSPTGSSVLDSSGEYCSQICYQWALPLCRHNVCGFRSAPLPPIPSASSGQLKHPQVTRKPVAAPRTINTDGSQHVNNRTCWFIILFCRVHQRHLSFVVLSLLHIR